MLRRSIAAALHPDDGESSSMRIVEYVLAFVALLAAGFLAFVR